MKTKFFIIELKILIIIEQKILNDFDLVMMMIALLNEPQLDLVQFTFLEII